MSVVPSTLLLSEARDRYCGQASKVRNWAWWYLTKYRDVLWMVSWAGS